MTQSLLRGGCLCGSIQYEITGTPTKLYHCHCLRCRKATGTGHATNVLVAPGAIKWVKGETLLRSYKIPEAKRFTNVFCGNCGARLPRFVPETGFIVVPAGSLDSDLPPLLQARIFWNSRAAWSCSGEALPVHAEYAT